MRWKVMYESATTKSVTTWSLGYPTRKAASAAARRLTNQPGCCSRFLVEKMTPEDEALASQLERHQ